MAVGPINRFDRKTCNTEGLASAPQDSTLRMDGLTHPRSCRHFLVPSVRASPPFKTAPWCFACSCLGSCCHHIIFGHGVRGALGPDKPRLWEIFYAGRTGSSLCTFRMGHPPRPRSCSLPLVCRVHASPLGHLSQDASGRQGSFRMAPTARCRTPRQCQRLRIRMLRPGRARSLAPAPAQHSMTSQSTGYFHSLCPAQYRTRAVCSQHFGSGISKKLSSHVGTVETLGAGSSGTASEGARIADPSRPLGPDHEREGCLLGGDAGATGFGGLTSPSVARRRGFSALADAACCAAFKGSAGGSGETATNASVQQHRDVGVPRNSQ